MLASKALPAAYIVIGLGVVLACAFNLPHHPLQTLYGVEMLSGVFGGAFLIASGLLFWAWDEG